MPINRILAIHHLGWNLCLVALAVITILGTTHYYTHPFHEQLDQPEELDKPTDDMELIRSAMTSVVQECQLQPMIETMVELQAALMNQRSPYDWVFLSNEDLTDDFKETISKFSGGSKVLYQLISEDMKAHPGLTAPVSGLETGPESLNDGDHTNVNSTRIVTSQMIANYEILQDYNWLMMVSPGSKFPTVFDYDIFYEMQDRGIVYGYGKPDYIDGGDNHHAGPIDQQRCQPVEYPQNVGSIPWTSELAEVDDLDEAGDFDDEHVLGGKRNKVIFNGTMRLGGHEVPLNGADTDAESLWSTGLVRGLGMPGASFEIAFLDIFRDPSYSEISKVVGRITADHVFSSPALYTESGCQGHTFQGDEASGPIETGGASVGAPGMAARRQRTSGVFIVLDDSSRSLSALHAH